MNFNDRNIYSAERIMLFFICNLQYKSGCDEHLGAKTFCVDDDFLRIYFQVWGY